MDITFWSPFLRTTRGHHTILAHVAEAARVLGAELTVLGHTVPTSAKTLNLILRNHPPSVVLVDFPSHELEPYIQSWERQHPRTRFLRLMMRSEIHNDYGSAIAMEPLAANQRTPDYRIPTLVAPWVFERLDDRRLQGQSLAIISGHDNEADLIHQTAYNMWSHTRSSSDPPTRSDTLEGGMCAGDIISATHVYHTGGYSHSWSIAYLHSAGLRDIRTDEWIALPRPTEDIKGRIEEIFDAEAVHRWEAQCTHATMAKAIEAAT